jgi:hypothetical protein
MISDQIKEIFRFAVIPTAPFWVRPRVQRQMGIRCEKVVNLALVRGWYLRVSFAMTGDLSKCAAWDAVNACRLG